MDSCVVKQLCFLHFQHREYLINCIMEHSFLRHTCDGRISDLKRGNSATATYHSRNRHPRKQVGCRLSLLDIE